MLKLVKPLGVLTNDSKQVFVLVKSEAKPKPVAVIAFFPRLAAVVCFPALSTGCDSRGLHAFA